nr:1,4-dihydroxy-2-naphthoate polyprenyltransferase [Salsipaludibacter albus]
MRTPPCGRCRAPGRGTASSACRWSRPSRRSTSSLRPRHLLPRPAGTGVGHRVTAGRRPVVAYLRDVHAGPLPTDATPATAWREAVRLRTLPAAVAPVLVGTAASATAQSWAAGDGPAPSWVRMLLAASVALLLQVAVNFANDYFDGVAGIDTTDRVGPLRGVGSGLVSPAAMRTAMLATLGAAAVVGVVLAALAGWELLLVGALALVATLGYSGGDRPIASRGLGEVVVFVFFGLVATVGSAWVQDEAFTWLPVVVAVPVGGFAVALLVVNNLRDIPTDRATGKDTLAVRIGRDRTRSLYLAIVVTAYLVVVVLATVRADAWIALPFLTVPLVLPAVRRVRTADPGPELVAALGTTARTQLAFAVLLGVGLLLGPAGATS